MHGIDYIINWKKINLICLFNIDTHSYDNKFGLKDLVNLICFGDVSVNGVDKLGMSVNEKKHG